MSIKHDVDTKLLFQIGTHLDEGTATFVHNKVYELGNVNAVCVARNVDEKTLPGFIEAAKALKIAGFDLTTPLKSAIIPYLDECDEVSRTFQCVNGVKMREGKLIGIGLDGIGMKIALELKCGEKLAGSKAVILGAGAVAGLIASALCEGGIREFVIANRTVAKAERIARNLKERYEDVSVCTGPLNDEFLTANTVGFDIAVQCTTLSMEMNRKEYMPWKFVEYLAPDAVAADVSYPLTPFLKRAQEAGLEIIDGKSMLAWQQIAMMKFHFDCDLSAGMLPEIEEIVDVAVAMREARKRRLPHRLFVPPQKL